MSAQRSSHRATWLTNGAVLVTGGATSTGVTATAELFHPLTGSFERTGSMRSQRELHTATRLTNGAVLVAGGINGSITLSSAELFEPTSGSFVPTGNMETVRSEQGLRNYHVNSREQGCVEKIVSQKEGRPNG